MKKLLVIALMSGISLAALAQQKKAVFIIIDGVAKDVIEQRSTPNIDAISKEGALLSAFQGGERGAYNETPTISAPGYNNVITGVWFNKHNVPDNAIKAPNYHYPTIFRFFKNQYPEKKIAIFSSWLDNRTKLVGEGLTQTGNIKFDYSYDGLELDTLKFPHHNPIQLMADIDQAVVNEAARVIQTDAPDLSWIYLQHTDDMGHTFGDSDKYYDAVEATDRRIGQIWAVLKQREKAFNEKWLIVVTTDHGRDVKTGKGHGGQSDRERAAWMATNASALNVYAEKGALSVVDILPTLARHLNTKLSVEEQRELDGTALIGKVSVYNPQISKVGESAVVKWTAAENSGKVKIWLATTNDFKQSGKADAYKLMGEVPVKAGTFKIDLSRLPASSLYKVVIEGKHNSLNRWIVHTK